MYQHIAVQDMWDYDKEDYQNLVLDINTRKSNSLEQAICLIINNDDSKCPLKVQR